MSCRVRADVSMCSSSRELLYEMHISRTPVPSNKLANSVPEDSKGLKVGIIGGGCLGRQLAHVLLQLVPISAESLRISTRRPEALGEEHGIIERG